MRGRLQQELDTLTTTLATVEDPYQIQELVKLPREELIQQFQRAYLYSGLALVQAGRCCLALKQQMKFGEWEPFVNAQGWSWMYVHQAIRFVELYAEIPEILHLPPGRGLQDLLKLPKAEGGELISRLSPQQLQQLTSRDLLTLCAEKRAARRKQDKARKATPVKARVLDITLPTDFDKLVPSLLSAIRLMADFDIPLAEHAKAKRLAAELEPEIDRLRYNLYDPAHTRTPIWLSVPSAADIESIDDPE